MAENNKNTFKDLENLREAAGLEQKQISAAQERLNIVREIAKEAKKNQDLLDSQNKELREIKDIENDILKAKVLKEAAEKAQFGPLAKNKDLANKILQDKEKELNSTVRINNALGTSSKLLNGISEIGKKVGLNLDGVGQKYKDSIQDLEKQGNLQSGFIGKLQGTKAMFGAIGQTITQNAFSFEALLAIAFDFSSEIKAIRQNLALSYGDAQLLRAEFTAVAAATGDAFVNTKRLQEAFFSLQQEFGTGGTSLLKSFPEVVVQASILQEKIGLSAEATANFAKSAIVTGKSLEKIKLDSIGAVKAAEKETGARLNIREVLEATGKVTGQIRAQLAANPEAIAKAVAVAKQFGMELEQVAKAGESLLNFEQSIEKELEAELLLGKQLNLEKARLAALTGDYETLTREINKNVGDFGDFTKLNVLQQKALANAVGLTVDELSDQLLQKENLKQLAEEARAAGNEELAQQLEARDAQDKFNDAVAKLKGIFVDIVGGPLSGFIDGIASLMTIIGPIAQAVGYVFESMAKLATLDFENMSILQGIVGAIALSTLAIMTYEKITRGIRIANVVLQRQLNVLKMREFVLSVRTAAVGMVNLMRSVGTMIVKAFIAGASAPFPLNVVLMFGLAAIAGAMGAALISKFGATKGDDIMSDGYGKRTLLMPEGAIRLNDKDTVIAGTNLGGTKGDDVVMNQSIRAAKAPPPPPAIDYDQLAGAMANVQVRNEIVYDDYSARFAGGKVERSRQLDRGSYA